MIQIKPVLQYEPTCPYCGVAAEAMDILWQGIHVCVEFTCPICRTHIVEDLPVGHAMFTPFRVDTDKWQLFGCAGVRDWFGQPLLRALQSPKVDVNIDLHVEKFYNTDKVIILNCIDYLYGHCLLKLLNAAAHLKHNPDLGLVVIVPTFLRWMVPKGIAEIWTVDIPLSLAQNYYPILNKKIEAECRRFQTIYLSPAHFSPMSLDITDFTGVKRHSFDAESYRITYVWREDRPWWNHDFSLRVLNKLRERKIPLFYQNLQVRLLFSQLRRQFPQARFTVTGLGTFTQFPAWIDDKRVNRFDEKSEHQICRLYSESRLVIGVHGSNMLLPSAHAGMVMDLMPNERWRNIAQDILYQQSDRKQDDRTNAYRFRYIPINTSLRTLSDIGASMIQNYRDNIASYNSAQAEFGLF